MTSYEDSPPDEGYSEAPLTVGTSGALPSWMASMTVPERTGEWENQRNESV
jgi:F-box and WD-40 domain protein 1/11